MKVKWTFLHWSGSLIMQTARTSSIMGSAQKSLMKSDWHGPIDTKALFPENFFISAYQSRRVVYVSAEIFG
jgi:hypothetical protein